MEAYTEAYASAAVKAAQCLVDHDAIPEGELRKATWLKGKKIIPNIDFTNWFNQHDRVKYKGHILSDLIEQARDAGETWKCPL
ncbi:hypothetical protein ACFHYQ_25535 [Sphaerimonospora cavernae]|uniref:Uncharacterized protein n=1 Tax=Sphaerimonospora cavernae TaxID=1740611 RepID=A0ABV6UBW2_9ACTN